MPRITRATPKAALGAAQRSNKQARQAEREIIVTLRLPRELHARLKEIGGERGLTAQIRNRLEASLTRDPQTQHLLDAIAAAAEVLPEGGPVSRMLRLDPSLGAWHKDPLAYAGLARAVPQLMSLFGPGEPEDVDDAILQRIADAVAGAALHRLTTHEDEGSQP